MSAMNWKRREVKENTFHVRLSFEQEQAVRTLSNEYNIPVTKVIRDLMADGLTAYAQKMQI